jgi:hypothetical protein
MKPEMLDALLLDRALGELSPEVAALLDAHLTQNAAASGRAAVFSTALDLSGRALTNPRATPRPLDHARLRHSRAAASPVSRGGELLRLAACLAFGLGLGWLMRPTEKSAVLVSVAPTSLVTPARASDPATQFWSVARFAPNSAALHAQKNR